MVEKNSRWLVGCILICCLAAPLAWGQHNPNGWIQTSGWNLLFPLLHPFGCDGGGPARLEENWLAPHRIELEDPACGTFWGDINFGDTAVAAGYDIGGLAPAPIWVSEAFLEAAFGGNPGFDVPAGDLVDFQAMVDHLNAVVVPVIPGAVAIPSDSVLGLATTYLRNRQSTPLLVGICTASDDSIQVWVNDVRVTSVSACRGAANDCAEIRLAVLPPGVSKIAVLVWDGVGRWGFRLGVKTDGVSSRDGDPRNDRNLTDADAGPVEFIGSKCLPNEALEGQTQYRVRRSTSQGTFRSPAASTRVTLRGQGPGNPDDRLLVEERVDREAGAVVVSDSGGGSVSTTATELIINWNVTRGVLDGQGVSYVLRASGGASLTTHSGQVEGRSAPRPVEAIVEGPATIRLDSTVRTVGPANLTAHDIGLPPAPGSASFQGGEYVLRASGADIWNEGDQFHFAYRQATGDFEAIARVTRRIDPPRAGRWGKHGLMARYTCDPNSKHSMVQTLLASPGQPVDLPRHAFRVNHLQNGPNRENYFVNDGALPGFPRTGNDRIDRRPQWMKLLRRENTIYSYLAFDDPRNPGSPLEWCLVGSDTDPRRPGTLLVGMALTAHTGDTGVLGEIRFDRFQLRDRLEQGEAPCVPSDRRFGPTPFNDPLDILGVVRRGGDFTPALVGGRLRLTEDGFGGSAVAAWMVEAPVELGFVAEFDAYMTKGAGGCPPDSNPADGMTFTAIQVGNGRRSDSWPPGLEFPTLAGESGNSLGYGGGTLRERAECHPSFAVEFDNWVGGGEPPTDPGDGGSPSFDCSWHVGLDVNGSVASAETGAGLRRQEAIAINFAADEPAPAQRQNSSFVDGPAGLLGTAVWNNVERRAGGPVALVNAAGAPTAATVTWASNNTWSSTGRGQENNVAPAGEDRDLMTGYLDTTDTSSTTVTVEGLPAGRHRVYVYIKGGVNGRGGDYRLDSGPTLRHIDRAPFDGVYTWGKGGDVISFTASGPDFRLTAQPTTGDTRRAPINALEIVPAGIDPSALPDIYDRRGVHVEVAYQRGGRVDVTLSGWRDGLRVENLRVLSTSIPPLEGTALLGFTAGTGGATVRQEIDDFLVSLCEPPFRRGDASADGRVDIGDAALLLCRLFQRPVTPPLPCEHAADANDDGVVNIADPVRNLAWLFSEGFEPPDPGPLTCGPDPTADLNFPPLSCASYPACDTPAPRREDARSELRLAAPASVTGSPGERVTFEAFARLCNVEELSAWSLSMAASGCRIVAATTSGTEIENVKGGGPPDFHVSETTDSGGLISGTLVDFLGAIGLPATSSGKGCGDPRSLLRLRVEATIPPAGSGTCTLEFRDGEGRRHPIENVVVTTCPPEVRKPVLGRATVRLGRPGGLQRPMDCNQDGNQDISDAICVLGHLFLGNPATVPCGNRTIRDDANRALLDCDLNGRVDIGDAVCLLSFLFAGGPAPENCVDPGCRECTSIPTCPPVCR